MWLLIGWMVNGQLLAAEISRQKMLQNPENIPSWITKNADSF